MARFNILDVESLDTITKEQLVSQSVNGSVIL
jgi:hypothetical protein